MALTKVAPAGIGSTPGTGYVIGDSFLHSTGLNATNAYYTGIVTSQNIRVLGDLQVDGTTTTLDTAVTEVDKLEVAANNTTVGVAITQSGSGDILNLYDGSSEVFSVADGGAVTTSGDISVGGDLTLPDAIVHSGDTDTKIRFPATDTVTVETAGSERLRITSGGNVGIGTGIPSKQLDVAGDIRAVGATPQLIVGDTFSNTRFIFGYDQSRAGHNLGSKILADGLNIGYYTRLTQNGSHIFYTNNSGSDAERLRITSDGKVGIGTDNPDYNLTIGDGNSYVIQNLKSKNDEFGEFRFGDPEGVAQGKITYDHGTDSLRFTTNGDGEKLRIASDGKILTAGAATVPLTSAGGIDACSGLYSVVIGGNTGGGSNQNQRTDGGNKEGRLVSAHKTNAEEPVSIATIFNLGTQNLLYFGGGSSLVNAATDIAFYTAANTTTTGGTERVRITSAGLVGIGTADPGSHKLYVNGPTLIESPGNNAGTTLNTALYVKVPRNKISMFVGQYDSFSGAGIDEYSGDIRFNGANIAWGDISYYPTGDTAAGSFRFTRNGSTVGSTPNARIGVGGIWMPGNGKITLNNGDAEIEGQSSYHLRVRTYDGSSSMRQMMKFYGGTSTGHVKIGGDSGISNGFTPLHFNSSNSLSSGYTQGSSTRFIGQIAPGNVGNSYLHAKIDMPGGAMFWVHSWGYTYSGGMIHNSQAVGYIYGGNIIATSVLNQNSNRALAVYRASDGNLVMRIYAAHGTTNAWGYFAFEGGLDGITGVQSDYCMRILAYTWSASSAAQY
jgi:hypothetical protein